MLCKPIVFQQLKRQKYKKRSYINDYVGLVVDVNEIDKRWSNSIGIVQLYGYSIIHYVIMYYVLQCRFL